MIVVVVVVVSLTTPLLLALHDHCRHPASAVF